MSETAETPEEDKDSLNMEKMKETPAVPDENLLQLQAQNAILQRQVDEYNTALTESQESLSQALEDLDKYKKPCARCAHDNILDLKVDEQVLKAYFAAVMSKKPFSKEYTIGPEDSKLSIEYRTLSSKESEEKARMEYRCKIAEEKGEPKYNMLDFAKIGIMAHLKSLRGESVDKVDLSGSIDAVLKAHADLFQEEPSPVSEFAMRCSGIFTRLTNTLFEASMDEDFWKGAGLG